jgi:FKBP-type peptidyl-prolyl cis-trans isomerase
MKTQKIVTPIIVIAVLVGLYFLLSKKPESFQAQDVIDNSTLQITPIDTANMQDLKIEDIQVGTGREVKSGDTVVMNYIGTLEDGTKFDSSYDRNQPFTTQIGVGQVIQGWDKGVPGMKIGGKRKLTIPYTMAYGERGIPGAIPPKSTLIFDVELLDIK